MLRVSQQVAELRWSDFLKRHADSAAHLQELDVVEATLAGLNLGDIGLRPAKQLGQAVLRYAVAFARLAYQGYGFNVALVVYGLHSRCPVSLAHTVTSNVANALEPKTVYSRDV